MSILSEWMSGYTKNLDDGRYQHSIYIQYIETYDAANAIRRLMQLAIF